MSIYFQDKSWPELREYIEQGALVILPLGMIEEHGPHLAVGTDAMIIEDITRDIALAFAGEKDVPPALVLPTFWSGYNMRIIRQIVRDVADEYNVWIAAFEPHSMCSEIFQAVRKSPPGGVCHACEYETSVMLHYNRPVDMSKATNVDLLRYRSKFVPADAFSGSSFCGSKKVVWSTWGLQESQTGIYGDPSQASKETGREIVKAIVKNSVEFLKEFCLQTLKKRSDS